MIDCACIILLAETYNLDMKGQIQVLVRNNVIESNFHFYRGTDQN
jgi:hypothetical protein